MLSQYAADFYRLGLDIGTLQLFFWGKRDPRLTAGDTSGWAGYLKDYAPDIAEKCKALDLPVSLDAVDDLEEIDSDADLYTLESRLDHVQKCVQSELKSKLFFFVAKAKYYIQPLEGWDEALKRFNGSTSANAIEMDVEEAGKCLAFDRGTACVFHLMRIVEIGVQEFGLRIGFHKATETVWDTIMDKIGKAIDALPILTAVQRQKKLEYQGVVPYLHAVRKAWRNPVMHPKGEYTPEQATEIFLAVRLYMNHLAEVI
jgi:hypothetical protein